MKYTKSDSAYAPLVVISLDNGESIRIENGSMVYHNGKVNLQGKTNGGVLGGLAKKAFTGESFFITTATGLHENAEIAIAPNMVGDIAEINVGETSWFLNDGAFLACDNSVEINVKSQGLGKAVFGGTGGLFIIEATGHGTLLVNGYGKLSVIDVTEDNDFICDNTHAIAWSGTLQYGIEAASGKIGFTSGEGFVNHFKGNGKVIVQSRSLKGFAQLLQKYIIK
ncbi:MAG: TIGR00266 family protein [Bacilli bacterium]|jgi:uncharacterized protein (TIGR00266 family)|nr:TIGR00266 family protein [Bacilli bacterium]